ncbi:MAG: hypothetical protein IJR69_07760 [Bacteroidaceae bacterium]|nr:hypothetical protein [Bacteroidaceae bacterium]
MKKKLVNCILLLFVAYNASAQCRYCRTYEDFKEDKWEMLDTVYCKTHTKGHKFLWGGSDFSITTGDKATDKMLKKDAFAVKQGKKLFVNCRNLAYQKGLFGMGYAQAMTMGKDTLFFISTKVGKNIQEQQIMAGVAFGAIGGGIAGGTQAMNQACYLINTETYNRGPKNNVTMINDDEMKKLLGVTSDLYGEYISEHDPAKRLKPEHIYPILKKAGLFKKIKQSKNTPEEQE